MTAATRRPAPARYEPNHEPSAWLRARLDRLAAAAPACRHTGLAAPLVVTLWDGGVSCLRCAGQFRLPDGSPADRTCDRCGRICDTARGDLIYPCSVLHGRIAVVFGLCRACRGLEVST